MGGMTFEVQTWRVAAQLRQEFAVPASQEPADRDRLKAIMDEIRRLSERVRNGDERLYSEVLGCWVKVTE